jgi:hypothetical protein
MEPQYRRVKKTYYTKMRKPKGFNDTGVKGYSNNYKESGDDKIKRLLDERFQYYVAKNPQILLGKKNKREDLVVDSEARNPFIENRYKMKVPRQTEKFEIISNFVPKKEFHNTMNDIRMSERKPGRIMKLKKIKNQNKTIDNNLIMKDENMEYIDTKAFDYEKERMNNLIFGANRNKKNKEENNNNIIELAIPTISDKRKKLLADLDRVRKENERLPQSDLFRSGKLDLILNRNKGIFDFDISDVNRNKEMKNLTELVDQLELKTFVRKQTVKTEVKDPVVKTEVKDLVVKTEVKEPVLKKDFTGTSKRIEFVKNEDREYMKMEKKNGIKRDVKDSEKRFDVRKNVGVSLGSLGRIPFYDLKSKKNVSVPKSKDNEFGFTVFGNNIEGGYGRLVKNSVVPNDKFVVNNSEVFDPKVKIDDTYKKKLKKVNMDLKYRDWWQSVENHMLKTGYAKEKHHFKKYEPETIFDYAQDLYNKHYEGEMNMNDKNVRKNVFELSNKLGEDFIEYKPAKDDVWTDKKKQSSNLDDLNRIINYQFKPKKIIEDDIPEPDKKEFKKDKKVDNIKEKGLGSEFSNPKKLIDSVVSNKPKILNTTTEIKKEIKPENIESKTKKIKFENNSSSGKDLKDLIKPVPKETIEKIIKEDKKIAAKNNIDDEIIQLESAKKKVAGKTIDIIENTPTLLDDKMIKKVKKNIDLLDKKDKKEDNIKEKGLGSEFSNKKKFIDKFAGNDNPRIPIVSVPKILHTTTKTKFKEMNPEITEPQTKKVKIENNYSTGVDLSKFIKEVPKEVINERIKEEKKLVFAVFNEPDIKKAKNKTQKELNVDLIKAVNQNIDLLKTIAPQVKETFIVSNPITDLKEKKKKKIDNADPNNSNIPKRTEDIKNTNKQGQELKNKKLVKMSDKVKISDKVIKVGDKLETVKTKIENIVEKNTNLNKGSAAFENIVHDMEYEAAGFGEEFPDV